MKASIRASWTFERAPAVMKNATSNISATPSASRFCARLGDKLDRIKCCSSGAAAIFVIGATLRSGCNARRCQLELREAPCRDEKCDKQHQRDAKRESLLRQARRQARQDKVLLLWGGGHLRHRGNSSQRLQRPALPAGASRGPLP